MKRILNIIFSPLNYNENFALEKRLYFSSLLIGIIICILGTLIAIVFIPSFIVISTCIFLITGLSIIYFLGIFRGIIKPLIYPVTVLAFLGISVIWLKGGGIDSPNLFPGFILLILALIIIPSHSKKFFLILFVALILVNYLIQLYYPEFIGKYPSEFSRWADGLFTSIYSAVFIYFIIVNIYKSFHSERNRAIENELKLKLLYDKAPDMYYSISPENGAIVNCNETFLRNLGYTRDEVIGRPVFDFFDSSVGEYARETFALFLSTGAVKNREFLIKRKDGGRIYVSLNAEAIRDGSGKILYSVSSWRDITEQKLAEKELKYSNDLLSLFIKQSPIYAFIKNVTPAESRIVCVSDNYENMVGIKASEMIGKKVDELFTPDFAREIREQDWEVVLNSKVVRVEQTYNNRIYDTIKFPIKQDGRNLLAGYSIDITDQVRSSLIIQGQNLELQKANADKNVFISILAHDLKNPFNALLGFSSLLVENVRKYNIDKIEKHLKLINGNSQKAYNLLEDILLWAQTQSGKIPFEPQTIDLKEISEEVIENINLSALNKNIRIESGSGLKDILLWADRNMLTTILRNLMTNAIKFTNWGGFISVRADVSGKWATIVVNDNGIGISKEKMSQLFDFTQKNSTSGTGGELGTGFGLILCKEFVEKHGGRIWVESEPGKGSAFRFTIPLN